MPWVDLAFRVAVGALAAMLLVLAAVQALQPTAPAEVTCAPGQGCLRAGGMPPLSKPAQPTEQGLVFSGTSHAIGGWADQPVALSFSPGTQLEIEGKRYRFACDGSRCLIESAD